MPINKPAAVATAPKPPKAAGTPAGTKADGTPKAPRAPKGPSLVWTTGRNPTGKPPSMDQVLTDTARAHGAANANGLVYIGPLVAALSDHPVFAEAVAAGIFDQSKVSGRLAKLRAAGVSLPGSGRNRSKIDTEAVAALNEGVEAEAESEGTDAGAGAE